MPTTRSISVTMRNRCIHAAECVRGLPAVFDTALRPWILPTAASSDAVAPVIEKCRSGALDYERRDGGPAETPNKQLTIVPMPDGPLYGRGCVQLPPCCWVTWLCLTSQGVFADAKFVIYRCHLILVCLSKKIGVVLSVRDFDAETTTFDCVSAIRT
jgi:uncharacterized Fe-S cluster protein YjdI